MKVNDKLDYRDSVNVIDRESSDYISADHP